MNKDKTIKDLKERNDKLKYQYDMLEIKNCSNELKIMHLQQRFENIKKYLKQVHNELQCGIVSSNSLIYENIERLCDGKRLAKEKVWEDQEK